MVHPEMGKITNFSDFENQNQITNKTVILKSKSNHFRVSDFENQNHHKIKVIFKITLKITSNKSSFMKN
jgi:hypothetical protein